MENDKSNSSDLLLNIEHHNNNNEHEEEQCDEARVARLKATLDDESTTGNNTDHNIDIDDEEMRLDDELHILRTMRSSFVSTLKILEVARDELNSSVTKDIDELHSTSQRIRAAFTQLRELIQ